MATEHRPEEKTAPIEGVPQPGDRVAEKYRVESILGAGAMGVVLAARHLQLGQRVAIKVLRPAAAARPVIVARFLREARSAIAIQSVHVVRIMDVGTLDGGAPYMVMEQLDGTDLGALVERKGPLPVPEAVSYVLQVCDALGEAHGRGIVHRDLKPANIFLTQRVDGRPLVKVLDFGIAKATEGETDADLSLTESAAILGSPLYMSPEQVRNAKTVDGRSDIWALGVILYKLLGNVAPFEGTTFSSLCAAIVADPPNDLRVHVPALPEGLERIIRRCLEKDPAKRFQTVGELLEALSPFAVASAALSTSGAGVSGSDDTVASGPPSAAVRAGAALERSEASNAELDTRPSEGRRSSRRTLATAVALVAAVIVGFFGVRALQHKGTDASPQAGAPAASPSAGTSTSAPTATPSAVAATVPAIASMTTAVPQGPAPSVAPSKPTVMPPSSLVPAKPTASSPSPSASTKASAAVPIPAATGAASSKGPIDDPL